MMETSPPLSMKTASDISLASLTTLRVGGMALAVVTIEKTSDIPEAVAYADAAGLPWSVIGGGSNILAADDSLNRCIFHMENRGIEIIGEDGDSVTVRIQAGESWQTFISWTIEHNLWGAENLAGIPGTAGATPVQNVGAYGAEVATLIVTVNAFDAVLNTFVDLSHDECRFGYRDSIFKQPDGERFIIASVVFCLSKHPQPTLSYKDLADRFATIDPTAVKLREIVEAVVEIRSKKFPDLSQVGTAGSFFKNPVVSQALYAELVSRYPALPGHEQRDGIKLSLAWVLDNVCHLKGHRVGSVALFEKQPLVLVAYDGATAHDIDVFAKDVAQRVHDATNIVIEREVRELK